MPSQKTQTKLFFLSIYQANPKVPLAEQSIDQITHRGRLFSLDVGRDEEPKVLLDGLHMPDGIATSQRLGKIFWTQMGTPNVNDGSVLSSNLDGSDPRPILPPGVAHTPKQIVLDEDSDKLYFCDREGLRIHRCHLDGSKHEVLVQTGDWRNEEHRKDQTSWCVGIAISKRLGRMFWTQKGAPKNGQGKIFSAGLDIPEGESPSSRSDIQTVVDGLPEPIDLEIDDESEMLWWTDRGEFPFGNTLNRKTIAGPASAAEKRLGREIIAEGFGEAIGLALDDANDCVWVADLCGRIWRCSKDGGAIKQKIWESDTSAPLTGLAIVYS